MCKCGCESKECYENYFVIYKGDDTDFIEGQSLVVEISTDIDLDGSTATFSFLGFSQTFDPIPSDKKLNIIIPHSETAKFPVGMVEATVTITNSSSKIRTVSNTIPIKVTQSVDEAYSPDNPNAISVTLSNGETGRLNAALDNIELLKKNKADKTDLEAYATEADLLAFYYPDGNVTSMSQITTSGIEYAVGEDGGAYVVKGKGLTDHDVVLPWKVTIGGNEYKVTAVGESAFNGGLYGNSFHGLTAPATVKRVEDSAFINCGSLASISLPSVVSVGDSAFGNCFLASVTLPSATSIGYNAFGGCISLTAVNLPSATSIGNYAFGRCTSLTSVNLPSATSIGNYAFSYCHSLTSINLPSAKSIGGSTFFECDFIKSVSLPSAMTINNGAFDSCFSLESVSIPSATSIGNYAFNGCRSLTTIDFGPSPKSVVPSLSGQAFDGVPTSCKFIIPIGMYDEWIAASGWSDLYAQGYKFEGYASTSQLANKANKATTLAGYGITDAATKTELNAKANKSALAAKADKATTLAGYGITDAETKGVAIPKYEFVNAAIADGVLTVAPYTNAQITSDGTAFTVAVAEGDGKARDCQFTLDCTSLEIAPTITWGANFHPRTDAETDFACVAGKRNVYWVTEYASGEFAVAGWQVTDGDGTSGGAA